jgi:site-specific recombinase XerD
MSGNTPNASTANPAVGLLDSHVESFFGHLRAAGYAERTLRKKRSVIKSFTRWTRCQQVLREDLNETHLTVFVKRLPGTKNGRAIFERAVLRLFLNHLRFEAGAPASAPPNDSSPIGELQGRYLQYLRHERGLAENSILVYSPCIREFLAKLAANSGSAPLSGLDAGFVRDFLLDCVRDRSSQAVVLLAAALRSFLRFLYLRGETAGDLSRSVPMVRRKSQASVPAVLSAEEVERVLGAPNRLTPCGRRDYAILLLLARLGLRAAEVVGLELEDLHWRTGEMLIRGKGGHSDRLPLLEDVGEALALYLRKDRGSSASRRVFLRMWAPRIGLTGPAAVGHVVRKAFARAGIRRRSRGAAHLFRHSLATRMIRHGASMAEIAEVLRHRSPSTTAIYAKVDFEALRDVARSWPARGGTR